MNKQIINPSSLAKPTGYANGILTQGGKIVFLAGQTAMDNTGGIVAPNDIVAQFTQALSNLKAVVTEAGGEITDIVKLNLYVTNKAAYKANLKPIGASYRSFFGKYYPAMTLVEVKSLFDDEAMIEIEGIAVIGD
ncbi:MAG: RidA family protein [Chloroflexi bacterium]|nr:RidA family protein [Chloroflexota bacterium]